MADPTQFRAWSGINPGRLFTLIDSLDHFIGFQLPCGHHPSPLCIHETKAIMLMVRNRGFTLILWLLCCNWNGQSPCGLMLWVSLPFRGVRLGAQVFFFFKKKIKFHWGCWSLKTTPNRGYGTQKTKIEPLRRWWMALVSDQILVLGTYLEMLGFFFLVRKIAMYGCGKPVFEIWGYCGAYFLHFSVCAHNKIPDPLSGSPVPDEFI